MRATESKNEQVIGYIAALAPGEKISVRGIAQTLGVSEGTAYRSIKKAEAQGLVVTRPKAGTVRISIEKTVNSTSLAEAAAGIGAICLCGAERAAEVMLPPVMMGDGSVEQLRRTVSRSTEQMLCLVGDRPDIHMAAVGLGMHILLTGGARLNLRLLNLAEKKGLCVYTSEQDSYSILGMLSRKTEERLPRRKLDTVRDWMQLPRYLYHDDMVGDFSRVYGDIFESGCICPVVNDGLKVCGALDSASALTAVGAYPSLRISEIMDPVDRNCTVSEDTGMEELAEKMIRGHRMFATVSSNEGLSGFISAEDMLRYFQYIGTERRYDSGEESWLEQSADDEGTERKLYTAHILPGRGGNDSLKLVFSAAVRHARELLGAEPNVEGGTFYAPKELREPGDYVIASEQMKRSANGVVLELELFDDSRSYIKCVFSLSAQKTAGETEN